MRATLLLLSLSALIACNDKDTGGQETGDTQPQDTDSGNTDTDTGEAPPVWTEVRIETSNTLTGLYATPTGAVAVVSQGGKSWLRNSDSWASMSLDTDGEDLNDLWGSGADASLTLTAVGNIGIIASYSGGSWTTEDIGTPNLLAVDGASASDMVSVGWGGVYANKSGAWEYQDVATGRRFNDIYYDGTAGMAVGEDGDYAIFTGETWVDDALDSRRTLYAVAGTSATDIWAVGVEGTVLHWEGDQWTAVEPPAETSLWDVWVASSTEVYVVGSNGGAWVWNGEEWTTLPTGVDNNLYGIDSAGDGTVWAIGNRGMVLQYTVGSSGS